MIRWHASGASPARPKNTLTYRELEGFLFTIACSPDLVMPSEWHPMVFADQDPNYADPDEIRKTMNALMAMYNRINDAVFHRTYTLPPGCELRDELDDNFGPEGPVGQWSRGFARGHGWLEESWDAVLPDALDEELGALMMALSFFTSRAIAESFAEELEPPSTVEKLGEIVHSTFMDPSRTTFTWPDRSRRRYEKRKPNDVGLSPGRRSAATSRAPAAAEGSTRSAAAPAASRDGPNSMRVARDRRLLVRWTGHPERLGMTPCSSPATWADIPRCHSPEGNRRRDVVPARDRGNELSKLRVSSSEGEDTMQTDLSSPIETLPYLDAFPYLATRLVPAGYHYNLLPEDLPVEDLLDIARRQARANRLPLALVLAPDEAWHLDDAVGPPRRGPVIPHGGCVLRGKLWLVDAASMRVAPGRLARLEADAKRQNKGGFLMGDLTKGGHLASPAERRRLAGVNAHGVPVGLVPCAACGEWHGEALDPSPRLRGLVVPVHCRCENHNRCARCGRPLADRRLNGNHYDETDGNIWHMPGFTALSHECGP